MKKIEKSIERSKKNYRNYLNKMKQHIIAYFDSFRQDFNCKIRLQ